MSDRFNNVTVIKKANIYFDGGVVSRTVVLPDGARKTLGIMQPGEYTFDTSAPETMEILSGELDLLLPGETAWRPVQGGVSFEVPGNSVFQMQVKKVTDYCCSYLQ